MKWYSPAHPYPFLGAHRWPDKWTIEDAWTSLGGSLPIEHPAIPPQAPLQSDNYDCGFPFQSTSAYMREDMLRDVVAPVGAAVSLLDVSKKVYPSIPLYYHIVHEWRIFWA